MPDIVRCFSIAYIGLSLVTGACHTETHGCTQAGCESAVAIELHDEPEHETRYHVRISYGDKPDEIAFECTYDSPGTAVNPDDDGGAQGAPYDLDKSLHRCEQVAGKTTSIEVSQRYTTGLATSILLRDTPEQMLIIVTRGTDPVLEGTFKPKYAKLEPNGPECGPTCDFATRRIDLATGKANDVPFDKSGI